MLDSSFQHSWKSSLDAPTALHVCKLYNFIRHVFRKFRQHTRLPLIWLSFFHRTHVGKALSSYCFLLLVDITYSHTLDGPAAFLDFIGFIGINICSHVIFNWPLQHISFRHLFPVILFIHDLLLVVFSLSFLSFLVKTSCCYASSSVSFPSFFINLLIKKMCGFSLNCGNSLSAL